MGSSVLLKEVRTIVLSGFLLICATSLQAAEIKYNENGRPVEFRGLNVGGKTYTVEVYWTSAKSTYEHDGVFYPPAFWGDLGSATVAAQAIQQALIDDGFVKIDLESYVMVPSSGRSTTYGWGVYLHTPELKVGSVAVGYSTYSGQVGFTLFQFFKDGFEGEPGTPP
jgi:hypothetical protein